MTVVLDHGANVCQYLVVLSHFSSLEGRVCWVIDMVCKDGNESRYDDSVYPPVQANITPWSDGKKA